MTMPIPRPSPNRGTRPAGPAIDILLLHYTGMESAEAALARLADPAAAVSAHYVVDEDGAVYAMVAEAERAWHAGVAAWAGAHDINDRSIGIEIVNPGHEFGYRPFAEPQMAALEGLARGILSRHPIPPHRVLGHSDVAPARKRDPGELFDWARLARSGIGVWPARQGRIGAAADGAALRRYLRQFGYMVDSYGDSAASLRDVVTAFQRHFRPESCDGEADDDCLVRAQALCAGLP